MRLISSDSVVVRYVCREFSGSAQNNHNAAFNLVFDEAIERSYMNENQRPPTKNIGGTPLRALPYAVCL